MNRSGPETRTRGYRRTTSAPRRPPGVASSEGTHRAAVRRRPDSADEGAVFPVRNADSAQWTLQTFASGGGAMAGPITERRPVAPLGPTPPEVLPDPVRRAVTEIAGA